MQQAKANVMDVKPQMDLSKFRSQEAEQQTMETLRGNFSKTQLSVTEVNEDLIKRFNIILRTCGYGN